MKKLTLLLPIICFLSCTKTVVRNFYTPVHDTLYKVAPFILQSSDTVIKADVTTDTLMQVRHDTLIITKYFTDSVKVIDTVYMTKPFFGDYKGDSVTIPVYSDSGLRITSIEVDDQQSYNPSTGFTRFFIANLDSRVHKVTVPNYPLSTVGIEVKYDHPTSCYVDLSGFQYEHILTDHIPYTSQGRASYTYVIISSIFGINARNN